MATAPVNNQNITATEDVVQELIITSLHIFALFCFLIFKFSTVMGRLLKRRLDTVPSAKIYVDFQSSDVEDARRGLTAPESAN